MRQGELLYKETWVAGRLVRRGKRPSCITDAEITAAKGFAPAAEGGATVLCRFACHAIHAEVQDNGVVVLEIKEN